MSIWAHTIVRNEERYLWYAVTSVIDCVDRLLLRDTGSNDGTLSIIGDLVKKYPAKIDFKEMGVVNTEQFTVVRQKMLGETKADWIVIVDGDEVWWDDKIKNVREIVDKNGVRLDSIVSKYYNMVGDMYHFQDESAGRYNIDGKIGNFNIRAFRNFKGFKFTKPHGQQGIVDDKNVLIQDRNPARKYWTEGYSYLHFTNMQRSGSRGNDVKVPKRNFKLKYDLGNGMPPDFYYPEVFFRSKPDRVEDVWNKEDFGYFIKALMQTPIKKIKRKLTTSSKSGY